MDAPKVLGEMQSMKALILDDPRIVYKIMTALGNTNSSNTILRLQAEGLLRDAKFKLKGYASILL